MPTTAFGARLRAVREAKRLSRLELAALCKHVSESTIKVLEGQQSNPQLETISQLAAALGVAPRALLAPSASSAWREVAEKLDLRLGDALALRTELERLFGVAEIADHEAVVRTWLTMKDIKSDQAPLKRSHR